MDHKAGEILIFTRDGILITEIDAVHAYIGTEDHRGYGPPNINETLISKTRKIEGRLTAAAECKAAAERAIDDPTVDCCGRDAADCDCESTEPKTDGYEPRGQWQTPDSAERNVRTTAGEAERVEIRVNTRAGRGAAVHSSLKSNGVIVGTACGTDTRFSVGGLREVAGDVTCKRCLKALETK